MMNLRKPAAAVAVAFCLFSSTSVPAQESLNLRVLAAWDDRSVGTKLIAQPFVENVKQLSGGRITFTFSGPEVAGPTQQFEPVSQGVFDIGFSTPPYFAGTTGVPSAFLALPSDSAYWREKGYWDYADREFQMFNQKLLAFTSATDQLHLVLSKPFSDGDKPLEGRKIRGNSYIANFVEPLGGAIVNMAVSEIYSAIEKGVVDGAGFPVIDTFDHRIHEVAKYYGTPAFARTSFTLAMNLDKFKALSEEDQKILLEAGRMVEQSSVGGFAESAQNAIAQLKEVGMQETVLAPEIAEPTKVNFTAAAWDLAIRSNEKAADRVRELREMAKANGDAK